MLLRERLFLSFFLLALFLGSIVTRIFFFLRPPATALACRFMLGARRDDCLREREDLRERVERADWDNSCVALPA